MSTTTLKIYVTMEGGICQGVSTNDPALVGAEYGVIDYDCDDCDPHDDEYIRDVIQSDGETVKAFIGGGTIDALSVKIAEGA
jgi:hypothetical protein